MAAMATVSTQSAVRVSAAAPCAGDLSSRAALSPSRASLFVRRQLASPASAMRTAVCCSAETKDKEQTFAAQAARAAAALALAAVMSTSATPAMADVAGLTPCKESKQFAKREKQEVKKLENRLKNYPEDSAPALALNATIEKTHRRFDYYGKQNLLCGTDGLPHLIVDGDQAHLGEFVYPGIVFLYITGWIGWVGRDYIIKVKSDKKPTEKEIIIDVPLALNCMSKGFIWPLSAISSFRNGSLVEADANITVSPR
jgi:photosystem I subunit 3